MTGRIEAKLRDLGINLPTPPAPVASLAAAMSSWRAAMVTGSNVEIARAIRATACLPASVASALPQASPRHGQHIQVRVCGTQSGANAKPSRAGVWSWSEFSMRLL